MNTVQTAILNYSTSQYPFQQLISQFLGESDLSLMTTGMDQFEKGNSYYKNMEGVDSFKRLYNALESEQGKAFYELYGRFITNEIRPQYDEPIYYQSKPSHRILFRDLKGEARFHRDSDYGHEENEINYWVPQTSSFNSNSIWIETERNKEDFQAQRLDVGQYLKFHGAVLSHGAMNNTTDHTRVSFDFRVIKESDFLISLKAKGETVSTENDNPVRYNAHRFVRCK